MTRRATGTPPVLPGYSYTRPLGSGGFADVFLYDQDMPRRVVAVKVLADDAINPDVLATFTAEADILARVSAHPSIVTIHEASVSADGRPYFVMEYCPDNMGARYKAGPQPLSDVLDIGVRMAAALETAHRSELLHRDIKPSNILVTSMGTAVLADFGIAAPAKVGEVPEVFAMSIPWSSPEVVEGRVTGSIPSEVWSLGATLYTLLAARTPFALPSGEKIPSDQLKARIVKSRYVPTGRPGMDPRFEAALERSLDKDPQKRFASMAEFAEELRAIQHELGLPVTPFEVARASWADAVGGFDYSSQSATAGTRGPTVSTVNQQSRRAARAQKLASTQRVEEATRRANSPVRSGSKPVIIGAAVGTAVAAVIVVLSLAVAGVF